MKDTSISTTSLSPNDNVIITSINTESYQTISAIELPEHRGTQNQNISQNTVSIQTSLKKVERNVTISIALVLAAFFICWAPFNGTIIAQFVCDYLITSTNFDFNLWHNLYLYTRWFGYFNTCLKFIIYAFFSPQFKGSFKKRCKLFGDN